MFALSITNKQHNIMSAPKVYRYKKGQKAMFNNVLIRVTKQLGVQTSDFSSDRRLAVSYQWKIGRKWSGINAQLVVHNHMIKPL